MGTPDILALLTDLDTQLLVSIQRVTVWNLINLQTDIGVLVAGMVIVYRFWLILVRLSFWSVRVENLPEAAATSAVLSALARLIQRLILRCYSGTPA